VIGDPITITITVAQLVLLAGLWAHLLSRLTRVEAQLEWLHTELRRLRDERATERARSRAS